VLDRVYAHSSVEMDEIDVIGFDFDHTLVCYKKELNRRVQRRPLLLMARQGFTDGLECVRSTRSPSTTFWRGATPLRCAR
jgi:hypothetical protein